MLDPDKRRVMDWLLLPSVGPPCWETAIPILVAQVSTFLAVFVCPHFAAATTLMSLIFAGFLLASRHRYTVPALGTALATFLLGHQADPAQ